MNTTNLIGRLAADPELGETSNGTPVCKARLVVDGGGRNMEPGYFNIVQYGNGGKAAAETLSQGWLVAFSGRAEHRSWKDSETDKWRERLRRPDRVPGRPAQQGRARRRRAVAAGARGDDDIPF